MFGKKEAAGSKCSGWWSGESNPQDERATWKEIREGKLGSLRQFSKIRRQV